MDLPFRHWNHIRRRFPSALQVCNTNFLKGKTFWIRRAALVYSYSFIFRGRGELHYKGQIYKIEAPCVFAKKHGEYMEYGPILPEDAWDELYLNYEPSYLKQIEKSRLLDNQLMIWPIADPGALWALKEELCALSYVTPPEDVVDRVDRLCERIIIESLKHAPEEKSDRAVVERILKKMRKDPRQPFNLAETVRLSGMSEATFRRRWLEVMDITPRRYLEQIRLQEACKMLAETSLPIREIAFSVGFENEFYFSRRFQAQMKMSPRDYRHKHEA